ncbi:4213_t:CDS:2 [Diversispora eburnea]|uniref:4213_t:CDS:1 n=2 Tax=Diversisporales TaxID=214509 RepID=A0A9N8UZM5_9GLOM|nr:4213_t:CDS:2 [Diversispora eburnea]
MEQGHVKEIGTLHLTTHQMIFMCPDQEQELWISYPIIHTVERRPAINEKHPLIIRCRDFRYITFFIPIERKAIDVFDTIQKLTCISSIKHVYAFYYKPEKQFISNDGWSIYNPLKEFERMEITNSWRFSIANRGYLFCTTYPRTLLVPKKISDNVLKYASKFRSRERVPVLSYLHRYNKASITRSSQPMVGLKQNRSIQDEKLIEAIFQSNVQPLEEGQMVYGSTATNLIIDARPTLNAMANSALGAGTENMENYKNCEKKHMGIDNIHVMRESLGKLVEAIHSADAQGVQIKRQNLDKSGWLKHISTLLDSALTIVKNIHIANSHVLVHCSDGWDRTAQLTSISELCLDPYYRTLKGFEVLVEKEWISFGHKFSDRSGHLSNEKYFMNTTHSNAFNSVQSKFYKQSHVRETSPVFHQFLDCVYQIYSQFPTRFEFNETFLIELHYHCYSCQFGTFLFNSEKERMDYNAAGLTYSVWDYFNTYKEKFLNELYDHGTKNNEEFGDMGVLLPDVKNVKYWAGVFQKKDDDLNGIPEDITDEKSEGFASRIRWRSDSSRPGSPSISTDPLGIEEGGFWKEDTRTQSPLGKEVNFEIEDPWRSNEYDGKKKDSSDDTNVNEINAKEIVQNFARFTLNFGAVAYSNVANIAAKVNSEFESISFNYNSNENNKKTNSDSGNIESNGSAPGTPRIREMMSFSMNDHSENNNNNNTSISSFSSSPPNSTKPWQTLPSSFPTSFLRNNRNSFPSLGIKTSSSSPPSPSFRPNNTQSFEKTSPLSLTPPRSKSKSNSASKTNSPLATPPIPSSPVTPERMKELPHPLYNDPLAFP